MIDEDTAHDAGRHGEKMGAVLPVDVRRVDEPQIRLVDECCCLEAVTGALAGHAAARDLVELPVDERDQPLEGRLVAVPPLVEQPGDRLGDGSVSVILTPFMVTRPSPARGPSSESRQVASHLDEDEPA